MSRDMENVKKDSKKFLKIYMFCLTAVVILLITASYFSQEKLNDEIDRLNTVVNKTEDEVVESLSQVEKLQIYVEDLEKANKSFEEIIAENEKKLKELEDTQNNNETLIKIVNMQNQFFLENYEECAVILKEIEENDSLTDENKMLIDTIKNELITLEVISEVEIPAEENKEIEE